LAEQRFADGIGIVADSPFCLWLAGGPGKGRGNRALGFLEALCWALAPMMLWCRLLAVEIGQCLDDGGLRPAVVAGVERSAEECLITPLPCPYQVLVQLACLATVSRVSSNRTPC